MRAVANAAKERNLRLFEDCKSQFSAQLMTDPVIKRHFGYLYNSLLEDNLKKII